ncbi:Proteasome subunit beta type-5 [Orbilia brochopaga]|uniref:Proteasome subunit beta type-5 n=1 Tax=Orbilia brochopaga TaxID=3140254 RepID=A0AAV9TW44_9PEZI
MDPRLYETYGILRYVKLPVPSALNFDPDANPITYLYPDATNMTFTLAQIDNFRRDQVFTDSIFSAQIGAAVVVLAVMLCITHVDKRKTAVFIFNVFNLLFVIIRGVLFVNYFMGPLAKTYTTFTWDTSDIPASAIIASSVSSVMSLLLMITTQISLLLQIRICYALNPRSKTRILGTCGSISAVATVAYVALGIYIIQLGDKPPDPRITKWANPTVNALVAFSIVVYSGTFCWRMFQSVKNRRGMGFTGLGSLESLLISGSQCLVFPALFCIAENFIKFGGSASLAQASIALLLPISHMWASSVQTHSKITMARVEKLQRRKPFKKRLADTCKARLKDLSNILKLIGLIIQEYILLCIICLQGTCLPSGDVTPDIEAQQQGDPDTSNRAPVQSAPAAGNPSAHSSKHSKGASGRGSDPAANNQGPAG